MKLPLTLSLWGDLPYRVQIRKLQQKELNLSLLIFKKKIKKLRFMTHCINMPEYSSDPYLTRIFWHTLRSKIVQLFLVVSYQSLLKKTILSLL